MDEDELDPRIQVELEKLNSATDEINKLEIELDEANTTFRMLLNECTRRLKVHSSKYGSAIESARPYYEALDIARRAQQECQQAAVSFQRANEVHEAAKETVALAESRFLSQQPEWRFDSAWQEMLNHATIKVRDAEKQRAESSAYHSQTTAVYKDAQEKVHFLEQRLRRNVAKSRPYFEEKQRCNEQLAAQKEAVETLAAKVARVKSEYAESLRQLEGISEEIHRKRGNLQLGGCGVREPGVGAELEYKEELEYCARETAFDKSSYSYDNKLNASSLPNISDKSQAAITDYLEIDLNCSDEVSLEMIADDDIWLDVDVRRNASGFQASDVSQSSPCTLNDVRFTSNKNPDAPCNILSESIPDNQVRCEVKNKLSFDNLHGKHFNPMNEIHIEKIANRNTNSETFGDAETASLCPVGLPGDTVLTDTVTAKSSIILQGRNSLLHQDEDDNKSSLQCSQVEGISVENVGNCVQEDKKQDTKNSENSVINSALGEENGAKRYVNGDILKEMEGYTRNTDLSDLQAQVCTDGIVEKDTTLMKLKIPTHTKIEHFSNRGLDVGTSHSFDVIEETREQSISRDICAQGDVGHSSNSPVEDHTSTVDSEFREQLGDGVKSEGSVGLDESLKLHNSTFHSGSRPADLELMWTSPKTSQVIDEDGTRNELGDDTLEKCRENVGNCPNEGNKRLHR